MVHPPCHSLVRLGNRLVFFFPSQWKASEIQSLKPPAKVMFRAFCWTCSKSSRAGLIPFLVSTAEAAVPQGQQLWGLYTATCPGEGLGLPWFAMRGWRIARERCRSCPPRGTLTGLVSHFLLSTALTTDGCTERTCICPSCVMSMPLGRGFAEQDKEGRGS